jgi:hypothetical protein
MSDNESSSDGEAEPTQIQNKYVDGLKILGMEFTQIRNKNDQKRVMDFIFDKQTKAIHTKYKRTKTHRADAKIMVNYDDCIMLVKFKPNIFIHSIISKSNCGDISSSVLHFFLSGK